MHPKELEHAISKVREAIGRRSQNLNTRNIIKELFPEIDHTIVTAIQVLLSVQTPPSGMPLATYKNEVDILIRLAHQQQTREITLPSNIQLSLPNNSYEHKAACTLGFEFSLRKRLGRTNLTN